MVVFISIDIYKSKKIPLADLLKAKFNLQMQLFYLSATGISHIRKFRRFGRAECERSLKVANPRQY